MSGVSSSSTICSSRSARKRTSSIMAGVRDWAATMKTMSDAALLHNTMVALLETAALQDGRIRSPAVADVRHCWRRLCRRGDDGRRQRFYP